jgi:hypothetical protein
MRSSVVTLALSLAALVACTDEPAQPGGDGGANTGGAAEGGAGTAGEGAGAAGGAVGSGGSGGIPEGSAAVTMAVGRGGRTTISCDDGRTWMANQIETGPDVRCWGQPDGAEPEFLDAAQTIPNPNWLECDHDTGSITGVVHHGDWFIRSAGWGTPGRTQRTPDGIDWDDPIPNFDATYLGLIVLGNALVAMGTPQPYISEDEGLTWTELAFLGWDAGHVRSATASTYGPEGSIVFITDNGIWWSADRGATYNGPAAIPCDRREFASGGDRTVLASSDGSMCVTVNGGESWQTSQVADAIATNPVWNGTAFHVWGDLGGDFTHFSSPDGVTWTPTLVSERPGMAIVGATPLGSFVAVNELWNGGYENQRFFRSDDGNTWETLPTDGSAFVPGHPIAKFASGLLPANAMCP